MTSARPQRRSKAMAIFATLLVLGSIALIAYEIYTTIILAPKPV